MKKKRRIPRSRAVSRRGRPRRTQHFRKRVSSRGKPRRSRHATLRGKPRTRTSSSVRGGVFLPEKIGELLEKGRERGFVTMSEILYYFPEVEKDVAGLEELYGSLEKE